MTFFYSLYIQLVLYNYNHKYCVTFFIKHKIWHTAKYYIRQSYFLFTKMYVVYFPSFSNNYKIYVWITLLCSINLYTFCINYRTIYNNTLWITMPKFVEMWITYPFAPLFYTILCTNIQFLNFIHKNLYTIHCANVDNL